MIVAGFALYFSWTHEMYIMSKGCLLLLAVGFLYWALWFWNKLQLHLAHMKDKEWLARDTDRKQLLKELKQEGKARKRQEKADRKDMKKRRKEIQRELRDDAN